MAKLGNLAQGQRVRRSAENVALFECVGVAYGDLVVARAALDRLPDSA